MLIILRLIEGEIENWNNDVDVPAQRIKIISVNPFVINLVLLPKRCTFISLINNLNLPALLKMLYFRMLIILFHITLKIFPFYPPLKLALLQWIYNRFLSTLLHILSTLLHSQRLIINIKKWILFWYLLCHTSYPSIQLIVQHIKFIYSLTYLVIYLLFRRYW